VFHHDVGVSPTFQIWWGRTQGIADSQLVAKASDCENSPLYAAPSLQPFLGYYFAL